MGATNVSILKGNDYNLNPVENIHRLFEKIANGQEKNNTAIIYEDIQGNIHKHTYDYVDKLTNRLARTLIKTLGNAIEPNGDGDVIIAVSMQPNDYLLMSLLAVWKIGAAYLPIDPTFPHARIQHILNEAKPSMVIYEKNFPFSNAIKSKSFQELLNESHDCSEFMLKDEEGFCNKEQNENIAIVLYTSGSTGVPKGVRLPHEVLLNRLQWQFRTFPYSNTERVCVFKTALTFVDSVCEIWGPLINGLTLLVVPKKITQDPEQLVQLLQKYQIERLCLVPSLLRSLLLYLNLKKDEKLLKHLKIWVCSGEPLALSLSEEFFQYFTENNILCNFYGSTEIMGDVTYHIISKPEQVKLHEKIPIGLPIDNTIIYLLDKDLRPVENGSVGELWVAGSNLAAGYVNKRDKERFITNPHSRNHERLYRTGDYARFLNGTILYEGRTDSQIKIRGHRVDLSEVERAVTLVPYVEKAVVLCYHPGEFDQTLTAFVTLKNNQQYNNNNNNEEQIHIEKYLDKMLASYMQPQVIVIETIPLLVNGKTDRQTLLQLYENSNNNGGGDHVEIDYSTNVPENERQKAKVLLETVASVLNHSARRNVITVDSNFYEIGGNSLNSIYTITKLDEQGYYISIGDFLHAKNLREILDRLTSDKQNQQLLFDIPMASSYTTEILTPAHKEDVFQMITDSFYEKADLEQWLMPAINRSDYSELLEKAWHHLLSQQLSFIVRSEKDQTVIGVALNMDAHDEPECEIHSKLTFVFEFLDFVEKPILNGTLLPKGNGKIFHCSMTATKSTLDAKENVTVMHYVEKETLSIAKERNFVGILTTNTSPLTQQLGLLYGYEIMSDIQVNEYIAPDGTKPFGKAPDSQRAHVSWKPI